MRTNEQITAQVALEAIIEDPTAYQPEDLVAVLKVAKDTGVAQWYLDLFKETYEKIPTEALRDGQWIHDTQLAELTKKEPDFNWVDQRLLETHGEGL